METENVLADAFIEEVVQFYLKVLADAGYLTNSLNTFCIIMWRKDMEAAGGYIFP